MGVIVRPALPGDVDALCELLRQLFSIEQDFTPDRPRQVRGLQRLLAQRDAAVLVAFDEAPSGARILGMLSVQTLVSTAEGGPVGLVEDVVVHEARRNEGIGRRLMDAAEEWARGRGLVRLQLLADCDNGEALGFYQRRGWQRTRLVALRRMLR